MVLHYQIILLKKCHRSISMVHTGYALVVACCGGVPGVPPGRKGGRSSFTGVDSPSSISSTFDGQFVPLHPR